MAGVGEKQSEFRTILRNRWGRTKIILSAIALTLCSPASLSWAGGGPENVVVVVNPRSWASMTVANHFIRLRSIPSGNVIYIDWAELPISTSIDKFRDTILRPILEQIEERGLAGQIDYIVYSSDFPYAIRLAGDFEGTAPQYSVGSITGLTYLLPFTLSGDTRYTDSRTNWYAPTFTPRRVASSSRGFRTEYDWLPNGDQGSGAEGLHYYLSTMLAYTSGRGNSVGEAIDYLSRSALADGTRPEGTVFFMRNSDVRSTTREPAFAPVAQELRERGIEAEIVGGVLPTDQEQVLGAVVGKANYRWAASHSTMVPGAICENLTSYGGILREGASQTPLTEFLRYGAAGSSGTVVEPFAIQAKFPHPSLHIHYTQGCSLAESFYQSVTGPYQLLVVGDPLCRPFARIPSVTVDGLSREEQIVGNLEIRPRSPSEGTLPIEQFDIFVDGKKTDRDKDDPTFILDTTALPDGYHELRVVAIDASAVETQGRRILPFWVNNRDRSIEVLPATTTPRLDQRLRLTGNSPGSSAILFFHNRRLVGRIDGEQGETTIPLHRLGMGPVEIVAVGLDSSDPKNHLFAKPLQLDIQPPAMFEAVAPPAGQTAGLLLSKTGQRGEVIEQTTSRNWLSTAGVTAEDSIRIDGHFEVSREDVYQLNILFAGQIRVLLDGVLLHAVQEAALESVYLPVSLRRGWHHLEIEGKTTAPNRCFLGFGGPGVRSIGAPNFSCVPPR